MPAVDPWHYYHPTTNVEDLTTYELSVEIAGWERMKRRTLFSPSLSKDMRSSKSDFYFFWPLEILDSSQ